MATNSLLVITFALLLLVLLAVAVASSSPSSPSSPARYHSQRPQPETVKSVSEWIQEGQLSSSITRQKRAPWDWSLDALKCSLKIISLQVSNYHDNQLMCCGLWWIKDTLKRQARTHCGDSANRSISVFNEMINENLIYSEFAKSLLGDEQASCHYYPEGSPVCDRYFSTIYSIFILFILTLLSIIIGFIVALVFCVRWRRAYLNELAKRGIKSTDAAYTKASSLSDLSDSSNNNHSKKPGRRIMNMLGNAWSGGAGGGGGVAVGNRKPARATFNQNLLAKKDGGKASSLASSTPSRPLTPHSDGRSSSASTNSTALPDTQKDDKM